MLKMCKDFYEHNTTQNGLLELYFEKHNYKKGDRISADLCIFEDSHTYVYGYVLRVYKHKIVMTKNYL